MRNLPRQIIEIWVLGRNTPPFHDDVKPFSAKWSPILDKPPSYDMKAATKEWSIAEQIFRLSWESNPVLPDKNPML